MKHDISYSHDHNRIISFSLHWIKNSQSFASFTIRRIKMSVKVHHAISLEFPWSSSQMFFEFFIASRHLLEIFSDFLSKVFWFLKKTAPIFVLFHSMVICLTHYLTRFRIIKPSFGIVNHMSTEDEDDSMKIVERVNQNACGWLINLFVAERQ